MTRMEPMQPIADPPRKRRRWFAFRLRTFFILLTAFGVWLGLHLRAAKLQKDSVAAFQAVGGECYYDFQYRDGKSDPRLTSSVPKRLRDLLGVDFFHNVAEVKLGGNYNRGSGNDLHNLIGVPKLKSLSLRYDHASDAGLVFIGRLHQLEYLSIDDESGTVSDAGVAHLQTCEN